jgi:hypothetical protein
MIILVNYSFDQIMWSLSNKIKWRNGILPALMKIYKRIHKLTFIFETQRSLRQWNCFGRGFILSVQSFFTLNSVEYHLLWMIISYVVGYSSPADDIQLKQMILIWRGRYSSRADDIHPMETIFIQERRISSMMVDSWKYNQPLEMIFNHWRS